MPRLMIISLATITLLSVLLPSRSFAPSWAWNHHNFLFCADNSSDRSHFSLDPEDTAFIFIEYQNEFTSKGGKLHDAVKDVMNKTKMLENSNMLLNYARDCGFIIIHVPIAFSDHSEISDNPYGILAGVKDGSAFIAGEWGSDFSEKMMPHKGDLIVKGKSGLCSFASTNLDFLLRQKNIKNVVLSGFLTNCCVESTMRTAYELNYKTYTMTDCVAATSMDAQEATLKHNFGMFSIPMSSREVMQAINVPTSFAK